MLSSNIPLKNIPRINASYLKTLGKLGLKTVGDFWHYFPFRYDDFSRVITLSGEYLDKNVTVEGKIVKTKNVRLFHRKMTVTEIIVQDKNNTPLKAVWFNQPFILNSLGEGVSVRLSGKLTLDGKFFAMNSPAWERASRDTTNTGRLVPVYSETTGLTSKWIRWQIKMILPVAKQINDVLSTDIRQKYNLYDFYTALTQIHFPDSREKLVRAQKRFAFEEMFLVQIKALRVRSQWESNKSISIEFDENLIKNFVSRLPFKLTDAQRKSAFEILKDLEKNCPMNRLLEGDVGSGKTVVAAIAALQIASSGHQVAIMAPTEILAYQHFESFRELFEDYDINIALLTNSYKLIRHPDPALAGEGSAKSYLKFNNKIKNSRQHEIDSSSRQAGIQNNDRKDLLEKIKLGKVNLVIGTHALIQKDVKFNKLAFVIIDEQHRFGVAQRAALQQETMDLKDGKIKTIPHLLTMTATPIPRTLAIAFFGSLDLSLLDEMPKNRKPVITKIIPPAGRETVYEFIKKEIKNGRQAFIILPFVEESKAMAEVKAAVAEHKRLSGEIFSGFRLGLLHGRLKSKEKEKVMREFANKKLDVLVSTPVVEVGIDVPNATVMLIENAERFGLSQLHQFRGRVGRGENQSYCFLFASSRDAINRVSTLAETNDGFKIAERDLELRGPGQFFGTFQSGLPDIAMENLGNVKLIKFARLEAQELLKNDPQLKKHPLLAEALKKFQEKIHLE